MVLCRVVAFVGLLTVGQTAFAQPAQLVYSQPLAPAALRDVQGKLAAMGAYTGPADGNWGSDSETALRNFQQSHGLQVTGEMNQATAATLGLDPMALLGVAGSAPGSAATPVPPPPPPPPSAVAPPPPPPSAKPAFALGSDSVRILQARLRQLGFYTGAVDGVWGGGSLSAFEAFQQAHGLPADGRLTAAGVSALGIDPASMQPR
jgi:peptidoglycan hydrolase-like protein with peptidoglycan-binding domain